MIKAELIQASNNLATNVPIYTFKLTYPKKNWVLDTFSLSKYKFFEKRLRTTCYVTHTEKSALLARPLLEANAYVFYTLSNRVITIADFAKHIFDVLASGRSGKNLTAKDLNDAVELFGPRLQDVLKQHQPGEKHLPFGVEAPGYDLPAYGHDAVAMEDDGQRDSGTEYGTWVGWRAAWVYTSHRR